ncbi:MAG: amidohydrolase, partial [Terriglobales bacterium]
MTKPNRILLALLLVFATLSATAQSAKKPADLILRNGRIYTSDPQHPWAEALAVRGTKIAAVGSEADVARMQGPRTRVIDLGGRMAMPGIIDSHIHFLSGSFSLGQIFLDDARSAAEIQRRVKEYAAKHPDKKWLIGRGWNYDLFAPSGLPTKDILDAVERDGPVVLENYDGHSYWVNSKALELAGVTRSTPNVKEGDLTVGIIVRDPATGEATGVLKERATRLIDNVTPPFSRDEKLAALRDGLRLANQHGLTSTLDANSSVEEMDLYSELHRRGQLTVRMTLSQGMEPQLTPAVLNRYEGARRRFRGEWVRAGVIKAYMDGVIESHTAAMIEPYADDPSLSGSMNYTPEQFNELVRELDRRKFHVITHAIGDLGIRTTLDAYEAAAKSNGPRDRRFRIEHIENIHPADIPRFGKLGVIASMQPLHAYPTSNLEGVWARNVGPARIANSFPWRSIAAGGARLNFGSDWPVVTLNPFEGLQNAVTRQRTDGTP